ncbi:uncharacterized protein LOC106636312 [Copidosoma floridanum]|uniref:uncharacterized protein LOC106636312 n=1 Tax=Copidosoma floridanum TaxID=29053 RepID=UPI0006C98494|nr:uncharacterized protein LOC106636312 [Copidosoma floridanum]
MPQMLLHQEPGWKLERNGSALLLRRDSGARRQRVCFRCDVEVREYERDDEDPEEPADPPTSASPLAMCASCLAALCITVFLPWLLMGG